LALRDRGRTWGTEGIRRPGRSAPQRRAFLSFAFSTGHAGSPLAFTVDEGLSCASRDPKNGPFGARRSNGRTVGGYEPESRIPQSFRQGGAYALAQMETGFKVRAAKGFASRLPQRRDFRGGRRRKRRVGDSMQAMWGRWMKGARGIAVAFIRGGRGGPGLSGPLNTRRGCGRGERRGTKLVGPRGWGGARGCHTGTTRTGFPRN